jgi:UPF0755 protein
MVLAWLLLGPIISQPAQKYFYIPTGSNLSEVEDSLRKNEVTGLIPVFNALAKLTGYADNIRPGRYLIEDGSSMLSLVRKLRSGSQEPVRLVINKIRTKEEFAAKIGRLFEMDSSALAAILNSNDSMMARGLDTNTAICLIIPNSYLFYWNISPSKLIDRLSRQQELFWNKKRTEKAASLNLTNRQVYILASIVEEETNKKEDKGKIAGVYLNRLKKGMPLQADPTIRFAQGDFNITRVYHGHLKIVSPYNTYLNKGLPPGPICTPSIETIDEVLNTPPTEYLFFVASPAFDGHSIFAKDYQEHVANANRYREALDSLWAKRKNN